ncbi:ABC transporter ATP-binding protein [Kamptonema cortianum]|nr:ABC transporter ATP-binding protein [Oscillatoria laete-virens]MDK3155369.1 ABC transporter ATP-binding protein [Kamptonema cortianum]MDL5046118.1 ABC transporter ATP-binding protein [Oscillatoria amoena NRMC-F 0135]MDL5052819.1 ABC transporter ATP-binding protein [Oscillatoria laete-virens NRMC-F 0139]
MSALVTPDTVLQVENISKQYRLGSVGAATLRDDLARLGRCLRRMIEGAEAEHPEDRSDSIWALRDVGFNLQRGEVLGIIGKNGAGKSTLLKILSKITGPTSGCVHVQGRIASLLEVGTGFHPELSGRENIYLNGAILGMSRKEVSAKLDEIVAFSGVEKFLETPVKRYSSGMYVRLAFAVAAHLDPDILIVDEVLAVGDQEFQNKCVGKMKDVTRSGRTVIFVSHSMDVIRKLCSRAILLEKGRICADGTPTEVISTYLSRNIRQSEEFRQDADPSKKLQLNAVWLERPQQSSSAHPLYSEKILINIEYEVRERSTSGAVAIVIHTMDGINVFVTVDYDTNPALFAHRDAGRYQARAEIPACWLNPGEYYLVVTVYERIPLKVYDNVEALRFKVIDDGETPRSRFEQGNRYGVLQPYIPWTYRTMS